MASYAHHSSSSSSSSSTRKYEVFLSFRGEDTRKNFIGHLYTALHNKGVRTFIDNEELHIGDKIGHKLLWAIEQSRISIPVFSKDYVSSKWCLQELVKIHQCYETNRQIIMPIFFHVEPSDVRNQTGCFGEAFKEHQKNFQPEVLNEWKVALRKVGELKGWVLREVEGGDESKLLQIVVEMVLRELNNTPLVEAKYPIGLDSRVKDLFTLLSLESMDPRFVGICGMGGIGKTTLAKAVYNRIFKNFDGCSFIADIRERALKHMGLVSLQNQLLNDILKQKTDEISFVDKGSKMIEARLREKKVLIILDDVDHRSQLNALAGELNWFGPKSRIIITTRDEQVLKVRQVDNNNIYKPGGFNDYQSLQLFSMHAFCTVKPPKDYMQLSSKVANYACGLPLTLEVLGSSLYDLRCKEEWESTLKKLEEAPPNEVHNKLKISYDGLDENEKAIFLDIACFFVGKSEGLVDAVDIWEVCGFYPNKGLKVLIRKSLVKIGYKNTLMMHDQLRDMGRRIVHEESPRKPWKRSRLWSREDIIEVLRERKRTQTVEGIFPYFDWRGDCYSIEDLATMSNLRFLLVNGANLKGNIEFLPSRLRWLRWQHCPLEIVPSNFYPKKLIVLELTFSKLREAWRNGLQTKRFENLKLLNLRDSQYLAKSPDFSGFPRLEILDLSGCSTLVDVHESIGKLKGLVHLNLSECHKLMQLPCNIGMLHSLKELILSNSGLEELPESIGNLKSLEELILDHTPIHKLPDSIGMLSTMIYLSLVSCRSLMRIPDSIGRLKSLVDLNLGETSIICKIPDAIGLLEKLETLCVNHCICLESLPNLPSSLIELKASYCKSLERIPNLSNLKNLRTLCLENCSKLAEIQGIEGAESLEELSTSRCNTPTPSMENGVSWLFEHFKRPRRLVISDDEINNGISLCLVFQWDQPMGGLDIGMLNRKNGLCSQQGRDLTIRARIYREGKEITCTSQMHIENSQMTSPGIICFYHFQGPSWFAFPLKGNDEVEIEKFDRYPDYLPHQKIEFFLISSRDKEQLLSQQSSAMHEYFFKIPDKVEAWMLEDSLEYPSYLDYDGSHAFSSRPSARMLDWPSVSYALMVKNHIPFSKEQGEDSLRANKRYCHKKEEGRRKKP